VIFGCFLRFKNGGKTALIVAKEKSYKMPSSRTFKELKFGRKKEKPRFFSLKKEGLARFLYYLLISLERDVRAFNNIFN